MNCLRVLMLMNSSVIHSQIFKNGIQSLINSIPRKVQLHIKEVTVLLEDLDL